MIAARTKRALRVLMALLLWVGVSVSAVWSPPADARPNAGATTGSVDPWLALLDHLGGSRVCGDEDGDDDQVLCGNGLLTSSLLFVDPSLLVMSRGTCSRLLEKIFGDQTCDPLRQDCDGLHQSGVPPPAEGLGGASSPTSALAGSHHADWRAWGSSLALLFADDRVPASRGSAPIPPPPRAATSLV
ncbi:MAG: hypothetical protein KC420_18410 [Myxococcales bacterium]|nr:hypothetical protein [Myxococcales bacterium]MCB9568075.1 hypothetical protein [Myxococcales bacterium]MCB9705301.1 hypothetical protein [Myxococcales bacterium]